MVEDKKNAPKSVETEYSKTVKQSFDKNHYFYSKVYNKKLYFKKRDVTLMPCPEKPDYIKKVEEVLKEEARFNDKQKAYRKNVVSPSDLRKKSPKKVKNNNPQGLASYVFMSEVKACKNGFLYYTIPLIFSIVFLIMNMFAYNFWVNISFSLLVLFDILITRLIFKSEETILTKVILTLLLVGCNVVLVYVALNIPNFVEQIYLPYMVKLLFIIFCIYHFSKFYIVFLRVYHDDLELAKTKRCVQVYSGDPGSYKSFTMCHDASIIAKLNWIKLCLEFWVWHSREKEILKRNDPDELMRYYDIKRSYEFYSKSKCIPCLHSINGIKDRSGRYSHKITLDHLRGLKVLPRYSVIVLDEVGSFLRAQDGMINKKQAFTDISDTFRLGRQYYKWTVLCSEQDYTNIFKDVRRVVGFNRVMNGGTKICEPVFLKAVLEMFEFIKTDSFDKKIRRQPKSARFYSWLKNFTYSIGFVKVESTYYGNSETGEIGSLNEGENRLAKPLKSFMRYMPPTGVNIYSTDAYKGMNPSYYDKEIECEIHTSLNLDGRQIENRKFINETDLIAEKRDAIDKITEKI